MLDAIPEIEIKIQRYRGLYLKIRYYTIDKEIQKIEYMLRKKDGMYFIDMNMNKILKHEISFALLEQLKKGS